MEEADKGWLMSRKEMCEWVNVSSDTGSPGQGRKKGGCVCECMDH